jgi:hypothetical protein
MQVDTHTQPYQDARRQQRHLHLQDVQASGYYSAPATGNFLIPEAQGTFTFSAEPASMVYDGSIISSTTPGQDSILTPNIGSSLDSSLHPDMSYPPPNFYNESQNYRLSPGSYYANGQNISPEQSVEHFSPDAQVTPAIKIPVHARHQTSTGKFWMSWLLSILPKVAQLATFPLFRRTLKCQP